MAENTNKHTDPDSYHTPLVPISDSTPHDREPVEGASSVCESSLVQRKSKVSVNVLKTRYLATSVYRIEEFLDYTTYT